MNLFSKNYSPKIIGELCVLHVGNPRFLRDENVKKSERKCVHFYRRHPLSDIDDSQWMLEIRVSFLVAESFLSSLRYFEEN